jgi:hypothetical protein
MSTIQTGAWRTGADGTFKVFIRGCEQQAGTTVEVISLTGKSTYTVITGTYCKGSGGHLYTFKYARKPEPAPSSTNTIKLDGPQPKTKAIEREVSFEELNKALGLD